MKVSDVIDVTAELLGVSLDNEVLAALLNCYNVIEQELATDYRPIRIVEKFLIDDNIIEYSSFKKKPHEILAVQDFQGDMVKFKLNATNIELKKNYNGHMFFVRFNELPKAKSISDKSSYDQFYIGVMKYGIAAEYYTTLGDFKNAKLCHDEYKRRLKNKRWGI